MGVMGEVSIYEGSVDTGLAEDMLEPYEHANFPGMKDLEETTVYGKVANHWDTLGAETHFSPSSRHQVEKTLLTFAVRTKREVFVG